MTHSGADARLQLQLEHLRSDDRLRERAARAAELSVAERLELTYALCRQAMAMLDRLAPEVRERVAAYHEPLGPGAEEVLRRLARLASPR